MSQLTSTLKEAADKNNDLLAELRQTDYAPSSLKQNTSCIADLKSQIASTDKELSRLHTITEDERKDHVKYRDSNVKRYLYKMGGSKGKDKFASKSEKEEKEFLDAWQKERAAKESREELSRALENAEKDRSTFETDSKRHEKAQTELDSLYNSIFSGPTPDVPGEDQLEQSVQQSREFYDQASKAVDTEQKALNTLQNADKCLYQAAQDMDDAHRRSQRDVYFGGGTFTDMMERDALAKAQQNVNMTLRHIAEARRIQPQIRELSEISIDQGHMFSDVLFDNIFTDMAQHDRIKSSEAQVKAAGQQLQYQIGEQKERQKGAERQLNDAKQQLEEARKELQRIRAEAFESVANGQGTAPPQYSAVST